MELPAYVAIIASSLAAAATLGGVALGARFTKSNALAIAEHGARLAREQERERQEVAAAAELQREVRQLARERLEHQFEARSAVERFMRAHMFDGNCFRTPEGSEQASIIAALVGRAFGDPAFAKAIFEPLLVQVGTYKWLPIASPRPLTESEIWTLHRRFDEEMWRVIGETAKVAGYPLLARPSVPSVPDFRAGIVKSKDGDVSEPEADPTG